MSDAAGPRNPRIVPVLKSPGPKPLANPPGRPILPTGWQRASIVSRRICGSFVTT
jgi:hypothetical protein